MVGVLIAVVIVAVMIYMLIKGYQPQFVLFGGGLLLMFIAIAMGVGPEVILPKNIKATGWFGFDPFESIRALMSNRAATLGLIIMSAGGFAYYMNAIGASRAMVDVVIQPLRLIKSPYIVLGGAFLVGQILKMFIPSASGLGMLLMVTVFPILRRLGLGPLSATAAVACTGGIDFGPADSQAIRASEVAQMDPMEYFVTVMPVVLISVAVTMTICVLWNLFLDKKAGITIEQGLKEAANLEVEDSNESKAPVFYAILPAVPLILLVVFSKYVVTSVSLSVVPAMFVSVFIAVICEIIRKKGDAKTVSKDMMSFFQGMGVQFTNVVSLVVAGEVFAQGLVAIGAVNTMITAVQNSGLSSMSMVLIMTVFIIVIAVIMGSGNAAFFSFAGMVPEMSKGMGMSSLAMIMPLQFTSGIARMMSPISGAMIAESGIAGISPFDLVKRTFVPMLAGAIASTVVSIAITL